MSYEVCEHLGSKTISLVQDIIVIVVQDTLADFKLLKIWLKILEKAILITILENVHTIKFFMPTLPNYKPCE